VYRLIYWPTLQGRGEFVRLVLEDAGVPYDDVARRSESEGGGVAAVRALLHGQGKVMPGFAPPFLVHEELILAQMPVICAYLGQRHGLVPETETLRMRALQLQVTIADAVSEAHDTHHPVSSTLYYEDQKEAALRAASLFREQRLLLWLRYFDRVLEESGGPHLFGDRISYVDLALFQLTEGLCFSFPVTMKGALSGFPRITALRRAVAARPRLAGYLASERRIPFNQHGIFRHYPELDAPTG
jgi:glutathione S-transferase